MKVYVLVHITRGVGRVFRTYAAARVAQLRSDLAWFGEVPLKSPHRVLERTVRGATKKGRKHL